MTDLFTAVANQALGRQPRLRPIARSLFEPLPPEGAAPAADEDERWATAPSAALKDSPDTPMSSTAAPIAGQALSRWQDRALPSTLLQDDKPAIPAIQNTVPALAAVSNKGAPLRDQPDKGWSGELERSPRLVAGPSTPSSLRPDASGLAAFIPERRSETAALMRHAPTRRPVPGVAGEHAARSVDAAGISRPAATEARAAVGASHDGTTANAAAPSAPFTQQAPEPLSIEQAIRQRSPAPAPEAAAAPVSAKMPAHSQVSSPAPVEIVIGRIEIRAPSARPEAALPKAPRASPHISLADYKASWERSARGERQR